MALKEREDLTLVITRIFDAPRDLVFQAWTKPEFLSRWLGPKDFNCPSVATDFRPGGAYRFSIISPEGEVFWVRGVYREIEEPSRIVFTWAWEEEGERGQETLVTVNFEDLGDNKTKMHFTQGTFLSVEQRDGHNIGWTQCFVRLNAYVSLDPEKDLDLVITRIIDAPRDLIFQAWTDPKHVAQWWGPRGTTTPVCEMDVRPGGRFRTEMHAADGNVYPTDGVFLEIVPNEKVVFTDAYIPDWEPVPDPFMTAVITFEDAEGKTKLTATARHWTVEAAKKHQEMGFYSGWGSTLDRFVELMTLGKVQG